MTAQIIPAQVLAHFAPEFLESLTDAERLVLPYMDELWLRPEQRIPRYPWRYYGFICGRGFGKSHAIACEINRRVQCGEARSIALMAPTDDRVSEVQFKALIDTAPPWFRPETYDGGMRWPNGVRAQTFTPEAPGRSRSGNFDLTWLVEIVDWLAATRLEAFNNITTATRIGSCPQVFWDTTSKGQNDVIIHLKGENKRDPYYFPIQRGAMFDNPTLPRKYIETECRKYTGREYDEEILGLDFEEDAGALWEAAWLRRTRLASAPRFVRRLVSVDPASSIREGADETGIVTGGEDERGHACVDGDYTDRYRPEEWGDIVVRECADRGAAGALVERNKFAEIPAAIIRARATTRGITVHMLDMNATKEPFPNRTEGRLYIREVHAASSKYSRGSAPAAETEAGRVHMIGTFPELERQLTTYVPTTAKSPNRFDAFTQLITELRGLTVDAPTDDPVLDVKQAASAMKLLNQRLAGLGRGRGIGL